MINMEYIKAWGPPVKKEHGPFYEAILAIKEAYDYHFNSMCVCDSVYMAAGEQDPEAQDTVEDLMEEINQARGRILDKHAAKIRQAIYDDLLPAAHDIYVLRCRLDIDDELEEDFSYCVVILESLRLMCDKKDWSTESFVETMKRDGLLFIKEYCERLQSIYDVSAGADILEDILKDME